MKTIFLLLLFYFAVVRCKIHSRGEHVDDLIQNIVENDIASTRSEETSGLFEGDILIDEDTERYLTGGEIMSRDAVISPILYWPKGVVYYMFDEHLAPLTVDVIKQGIHHLKKRTCIKFVELPKKDSNHKSYVKFFSGDGCYSRIGRDPGDIEQKISIGVGCERIGTVVHEIMHALGFFHEHTRPDRDKYIKIDWKNIEQEHARNFQKYPHDIGSSFGKPYDYQSVMHYSRYAFSKDRDIPTIVPTDDSATIGQRLGLSYYDREEINNLYKCHEDCVDKESPYKCMTLRTLGSCSSSALQKFMVDSCAKSCNFCARRDNLSTKDSTSSKNKET
ncbi:hypothetical protein ACROYT_G022064 [Oculina patagonica]